MPNAPPTSGVEYIFYTVLPSVASPGTFQVNPTLAAGDVKVSTDGGAFGNIASLPTVTPAAGRQVKVTVSASEMTGDSISVLFIDAAGNEWSPAFIPIQTVAAPATAVALATAQTAINDLPTNAELATALGTADDAVLVAIAALNNLSAAAVNAEVVDALATDTYAEPGQGAPAATAAIATKLNWLYKWTRNKKDNDGTTTKYYADDASTVDQKQATSEAAGTVTKGEIASGP